MCTLTLVPFSEPVCRMAAQAAREDKDKCSTLRQIEALSSVQSMEKFQVTLKDFMQE